MTLACHICESNCVNKLVVEYFLLASSSSRGNGDNNANKDGGQRTGVQAAGCREQEAETGSEAYFPLKMPQYVDFKQRQRQRQRAERTAPGRQAGRQAGNNNLTYIFIFILILFLSARAIVGFITFIVAVLVVIAVASHGNSVKEVM